MTTNIHDIAAWSMSDIRSVFKVRPVRTIRDRRRFIDFPYKHYATSSNWVPPLRRDQGRVLFSKKSPFLAQSTITPFLATDNSDRVIGRIAAIINDAHLKKHENATGFFGFFECADRYDVAAGLIDAVVEYIKSRGLTRLRGPANPSINDCSGLLVDGFDKSPSILMPYNPPYYADFLHRYGFERAMTMWAYYASTKAVNIERLRRSKEVIKKRIPGLTIRNPVMERFTEEAKVMCDIYNQAFDNGWGHVPISDDEFLYMAKSMRIILDPRLVFFLEHYGRPIGFSLSLPDVNMLLKNVPNGRLFPFGFLKLLFYSKVAKIDRCRTAVLALLPVYQRRGLDSLLVLETIKSVKRNGYIGGELSWVMDDNVVLKNSLKKLGAVVEKEYAMFEKQI